MAAVKPYPAYMQEAARALRAQGTSYTKISVSLGVPIATVARWSNPEYAERQRVAARERKSLYGGRCVDCGRKTSHGNARYPGPCKRCRDCRVACKHANKKWTTESVVAAIHRFAAEHGRPPTASEWMVADPARGYPPASSVHEANGNNPSAPFRYWADAIVAAGFPRPRPGVYQRTQRAKAAA
jgi:hypothetical protein